MFYKTCNLLTIFLSFFTLSFNVSLHDWEIKILEIIWIILNNYSVRFSFLSNIPSISQQVFPRKLTLFLIILNLIIQFLHQVDNLFIFNSDNMRCVWNYSLGIHDLDNQHSLIWNFMKIYWHWSYSLGMMT